MARSSSSVSVSRAGGTGGRGIAYGGIPMNGIGGSTSGDPGINGTAVVFVAFKLEAFGCACAVPPATELDRFPSFALAKLAASLLAGCTGLGAAVVVIGVRRMFNRHVGQVCCRWNHDRKQVVWKMCPQGSFFELLTMSSRQMMQMLSDS